MNHKPPNRRDLLRVGGVLIVAAYSSSCDTATEPERQDGSARDEANLDAKEAPILSQLVSSGQLPPVEERLPQDPVVVEPVDRPGTYGGEWRTSLLGVADAVWMDRCVGHESLLRFAPDLVTIIPNIAESHEIHDGGTQFTFKIRRGIKWSDGEPFTVDDVVFAVNDVYNNRELFPGEPANPARADKVDDDTVRFTFEEPEGLFVMNQASPRGRGYVRMPKHYLEQFHVDYNPDVDDLVREEGVEDWATLFQNKAGLVGNGGFFWNAELPSIYPWRTVEPLGEGNRAVVERNPYYWKVDSDGRQLPYLDRVIFAIIDDPEVLLLNATNGEIDFQDRNIATPRNKPVLAASREDGGYRFVETVKSDMNTTGVALNFTHQDPVKREIFRNVDFRIGLSHAINRQEIVDVVFQRQGEPWQMCPRPETRFHNETLAKQYSEYDPDLANNYLDKAGYGARDSDGFRLGPDDRRISFGVAFTTSWTPEWADVAELLESYWADVGIAINPQAQDRSLWEERGAANAFDAVLWEGNSGGDVDTVLRPIWYIPTDGFVTWAPLWREWFWSQGAEGEEPVPEIREALELYNDIQRTPDESQQVEYMKQILEIDAEIFHTFGISLSPAGYAIAKNDFQNVPESARHSDLLQNPGPTNPEQYFKL